MEQSLDYQFPTNRRQSWIRSVDVPATTGPRAAYALFIAFMLLLYSNIAVIYKEQLEAVRPTFIVALAALFMMVVEICHARQGFKLMFPQGASLLALLGVCVVSTFDAIYVRHAAEQTIDFAKIVLVYLLIENVVTTEKRLRTVMLTMVLCGLFPAIGTIYHYQIGILHENSRAAWRGIFGNPNEAAYGILILIPLAIAIGSKSRLWLRLTLWGVIGVYLVAIFLTFSRGGFLALFGVAGLIGWKQKSMAIRVGMVAALLAGIMLVGAFWKRSSGDFKNINQDTSVRERIATFEAGGLMFLHNPLLGVGPGDSMVAYPLYVPLASNCGCHDQLVVHNSFIQALAELGLLGFSTFMVFIILPMYQAWKMEKGPLGKYATALGLAMWGFVLFSMSGGFVYSWWPYILVGLITAAKRVSDSRAEAV